MSLTIYKRGEIWHYRGTVAGRRLRGSTETSDETRARRIASEKETEAWKGKLDGPQAVFTFSQAAILYLNAQRSHRYVATLAAYWKDTLVKDITAAAIIQSAIDMYPTYSNSTRNRCVIAPTQAIINLAAEAGLCNRIRVKRFKVVIKRKKPVTWEWLQAFSKHADPHTKALAYIMFLTAARISEALDIRWKDIDFDTNTLLIRSTKIGLERWAHMPSELVEVLQALPPDRKPDDHVCGMAERYLAAYAWKITVAKAKIKWLSFHACRHGFATGLLHSGIDPITVAKLGGWKSPEHLFKTYGHAMDDKTLPNRLVGTKLTQLNKPNADTEAGTIG